MKRNVKSKELILERVIPVPETGCWLWEGTYDSRGYGVIKIAVRQYKAHRLSYELFVGSIGEYFVCHKCDTPSCVNPAHLFLGTPYDNMIDKSRKGRASSFPGETNPMASLTEEDVRSILKDTRNQYVIAAEYGIGQGHVSRIKSRRVWKNVE